MIHATIVPSSMLALMRMPTSMPEPSDNRLQFRPTPVCIVIAVPMQHRRREPVQDQRVFGHQHDRGRRQHAERQCARRTRGLAAARVEDDQRFAGRHAVGVGQLLVDDEVLPHRNGEQDAEQAGRRQPQERLQRD